MQTTATLRARTVLLALGLSLFGCEKSEECKRARLEASDAWKTVMDQAGQAKLKGWIGFDDLTDEKKAEHVRQWTTIETQAEMVFKSFAYELITWNTADPARQKANQTFDGYFAKPSFTIFAATLKTANERYDRAAQACGD